MLVIKSNQFGDFIVMGLICALLASFTANTAFAAQDPQSPRPIFLFLFHIPKSKVRTSGPYTYPSHNSTSHQFHELFANT